MSVTPRELDATETFAATQRGAAYVDVRSEPEFEEGRPAGAINVPWRKMGPNGLERNENFLSEMFRRFSKDAAIVIGCKSGDRTRRAAALLVQEGFSNIAISRVGFDGVRDQFGRVVEPGWRAAGLPIDRG